MLPWWGWVLLWTVLVVGGAALVAVRARDVWRSLRALTTELGRAADTLADLETRADHLREAGVEDPRTAVTQDPHRLRAEYRTRQAARRKTRSARRAERMPRWARVD